MFANVVLVDEINRAMPKTQSALLEAMAERQITVDGTTYALPAPFLVLANENPIEFEGVFPLPEAQLDRFFLQARLGYPSTDDELLVIRDQRSGHPLDRLQPVLTTAELGLLQASVDEGYVDPLVERWIVELVRATRGIPEVTIGASVRGSLALERATRAWALLHGRAFVVPEDVLALFGREGLPEADYRPEATALTIRRFVQATGARAFGENNLDTAASALRAAVGRGSRVRLGNESDSTEVAPYLVLAAFFPLGLLLWRRNLS